MAIALAIPALVAPVALAQTRSAPHARQRAHAATAAKKPPPTTDGGTSSVAAGTFGTAAPAPTAAVAPTPSSDAGVVEARTTDGGTKVFKFSELDIEGRLKSPQLVYFLRRVRAEFAAGDLGHRTFLREMSETRKERTF